MISYKLAKQLKEAGYKPEIMFSCEIEDHKCRADKPDCKLSILNPPTLEELIEWCGDDFAGLIVDVNPHQPKWRANSECGHRIYGDTPSVAVAKLGLKLHN